MQVDAVTLSLIYICTEVNFNAKANGFTKACDDNTSRKSAHIWIAIRGQYLKSVAIFLFYPKLLSTVEARCTNSQGRRFPTCFNVSFYWTNFAQFEECA